MKNENTLPQDPQDSQDQDMDAYFQAMAERFEPDTADIGCEFDN
jgi:hypothetical protein